MTSSERGSAKSQGWSAYFVCNHFPNQVACAYTILQRMFKYADRLSIFLYAIGIICMATSGTALPLLDLVFGQFVNTFNDFAQDKTSVEHFRSEIAKAR
jgi:ATP-binding cassette subfamily B (MDR/TAP) protein 1